MSACFYRNDKGDYAILGISLRDHRNKQITLGNTYKLGTGYSQNKYSPKVTKYIEMIIDDDKIDFFR